MRGHPLQPTQVNQDIDERVLVGNGTIVAQLRPFDAQVKCLGIDAFDGRALLVKFFVRFARAIQFVTHPSADAGGQGSQTAAIRPVFVGNRADFASFFREKQWADIATHFMRDERVRLFEKDRQLDFLVSGQSIVASAKG